MLAPRSRGQRRPTLLLCSHLVASMRQAPFAACPDRAGCIRLARHVRQGAEYLIGQASTRSPHLLESNPPLVTKVHLSSKADSKESLASTQYA